MTPEQLEQSKKEIMDVLAEEYMARLDDSMGQLHNQFVAFIASAKLPLPNVLLVLEIVKSEIVDQASLKYLGE